MRLFFAIFEGLSGGDLSVIGDLNEAASAADATACPIQAASEIREIPGLRNDRVSGYDEPSPKPGRYG